MPTTGSARVTCQPRPVPEEVISAAGAVFGVLELIGETGASGDTVENARIALRGADARLRQLGLAREDLHDLGELEIPGGCSGAVHEYTADGSHPPNVIPLRPPAGRSQRELSGRHGFGCEGHLESS